MSAREPERRTGVITVSMLAKIRRMHFRDGVSSRDISRRTGLSRNTVRHWLREPKEDVLRYPNRVNSSVVDPWSEQLRACWQGQRRQKADNTPSLISDKRQTTVHQSVRPHISIVKP